MSDLPSHPVRGRLKVFLGYSSGVGKSFRMLDEGRRRLERGQDVVVAALQPKTDGPAADALRHLPVIPMLAHGATRCIDVPTLLRRRPELCLVDGLAHDNPPTCPYPHRWQEVEALLAAGISVVGSVNLQFIAERRQQVERITGRPVTQTVPEGFLMRADEIELIDAPVDEIAPIPERRRQLLALRELALILAAEVVDHQLERYLDLHGIVSRWGVQERILVCITPWIAADKMIASGQRNAERFRGELLAAHVRNSGLSPEAKATLDHNLGAAAVAGASIHLLDGGDFVAAILPFARARGISQIYVGHSIHQHWWQQLRSSHLEALLDQAEGMDIRVFPQ